MSKRVELRLYIGQMYDAEKVFYSSKQVKKLLADSGLACTILSGEGTEGAPHPFEETSLIELDCNYTTHDELQDFCKCLSDFLGKVADVMHQRWVLLKGAAYSGRSIYPIYIELNPGERRSIQPNEIFGVYRKGDQKALEDSIPIKNRTTLYHPRGAAAGSPCSDPNHPICSVATPGMTPAPRPNGILHDHIGPWCVRCLGYLEPGQIGTYYPYGPVLLVDNPLLQTPELGMILGWTVPVHRHGCSSEGVVLDAAPASGNLSSLLSYPTGKLENLANTTFDRGNLNLNVAIRLLLSHRRRNESNYEGAASDLAKATISNGGSTQSEVIGSILDWHMPLALNNVPYQKIRVLLALGNRYRNTGHQDAAKQCYGQAEHIIGTLSPPKKAKSLHALKRRELSVRRRCASLDEANDLVADAKDDAEPYGLRTTLNYIGWDNFRKTEYVQAEDNFRTMLSDQEPDANVSWWHKMAGWLGRGAALYVNDPSKREEALRDCLKAEYVSAMLGLRVDVTRGISTLLLGPGKLLSTSAMVRKIGKDVSMEKMRELRRIALIQSGLQKDLLAELSGVSWFLIT